LNAEPLRIHKRITDILIEADVVTEDQVEEGLVRQRATGQRIGETLVEMGIVSEEDIGWALSRQLDMTFVDVHMHALDPDLIREFPEALLRRIHAVPLVRSGQELSVAVADPTDHEAIAELERHAGGALEMGVATPSRIRSVLDQVFGVMRGESSAVSERHSVDTGTQGIPWDRSGTGLLQFHLADALKWLATEIHFLPHGNQLEVYYRIGSDLNLVASEPLDVLGFLQTRIEALGGPAFHSDTGHACGRITHRLDDVDAHIDVSMVRSQVGTSIVLRPQRKPPAPGDLKELGLSVEQTARVSSLLEQPAGVIIVSGPSRSGGTTTLASLLATKGTKGRRVLLFESGVSAPLPGVLQLRVDPGAPSNCWEEIAVAQSADVVALDGVLNGPAIRGFLTPAAAGRLLLVRTDWSETLDLLDYLLQTPQSRYLLSRRLLGLVQQRLFRLTDSDGASERQGLSFWHRGVFEVLAFDEPARQAIREGESAQRVWSRAVQDGFSTLEQECRRLVETGVLSAVEAARVLT
jgi:type II secretory ATPase GspE/PulE/Tfp pilus assembly ATPase PilB-like protein